MINLYKITRKEFLKNGIYKITCSKTGKTYIGSCSAKDCIYTRLIHHRNDLLFNRHVNKYLQRAFNKYGKENFYVELVEECLPDKCLKREQYWIDILHPHYNLCKKAGSSKGRIVSQKTRDKISKANKKWINEHPEFRKFLSEKIRNNPVKMSKETKEKISQIISKRNKDNLYSAKKIRDTKTGKLYLTVEQCRKDLSLSATAFYNLMRGKGRNKHLILRYE